MLNTQAPSSLFLGNYYVLFVLSFILTISTRIYPNVPMGVAWNGNNIGGATKRAVGIAMHVGFGNLGGVIAGFSFRAKDAPRYFSGHGLLIATITMSLILCVFMHVYLGYENARRDEAMAAQGLTLDA